MTDPVADGIAVFLAAQRNKATLRFITCGSTVGWVERSDTHHPCELLMEVTYVARFGTVGWVERSDTHHPCARARWVSLRSTHPTAKAPRLANLCERRK